MEYFDFIGDQKFRAILERDFREAEICLENKASKAVLVLSGSIIETCIVEYFIHNPGEKTREKILTMSLHNLINEAKKEKLISCKAKNLSTVVKNYRNLIHAGNEKRKNEEFDYETAIVAFSLVKIILKEIRKNYKSRYGYKAEDIFNKILSDPSTYSIYEYLLDKINCHEQFGLLEMMVEYIVVNYPSNKSNVHNLFAYKRYIEPLKSRVVDENILFFCRKLVENIEKGDKNAIFPLYEIFGDNLNLLQNDKELVLKYIYNVSNQFSGFNNTVVQYSFRCLFSHLGLYLDSQVLEDNFFKLLLKVVKAHHTTDLIDDRWAYIETYNHLVSKVSPDQRKKCIDYIAKNLSVEIKNSFLEARKTHTEDLFWPEEAL